MKTFDPRELVQKLMSNTLREKLNTTFVVVYAPSPSGGTLKVYHPDPEIELQGQQIVDDLIEKE